MTEETNKQFVERIHGLDQHWPLWEADLNRLFALALRGAEPVGDEVLEDADKHGPVWAAVAEVWGYRCPDYSEHCPCCKAWAEYDSLTALGEPKDE